MTQTDDDDYELPPIEAGSMADASKAALPDPALRRLQQEVNANGFQIGVTLTVGGQVIRGNLCSEKQFFNETAALLGASEVTTSNFEEGQEIPDANAWLTDLGDALGRIGDETRAETDSPEYPARVRHVHLAEAFIQAGMSRVPIGLWRGRLSQVSGWSLGWPSS